MNNKIKILTKQMLLTKRKEKEAKRKEKNTTTMVTFYYDSTRRAHCVIKNFIVSTGVPKTEEN
jgi:hypothetical protein